jgi:hypothetical protein
LGRSPRNKNQTADLREFLKQKFDLKWLDNANQPEKLDDDNTLRISSRSNSVLIILDKTRTKARLVIRGKRRLRDMSLKSNEALLVTWIWWH